MYVIPSQGGAPQRLLPEDNGPQMDPNWSPDGRKVVFSSAGLLTGRAYFSSKVELRVLDLASHMVSVVPGSSGVWSPRWSPDGRFILGLSDKFDVRIFELKTQRWTKLADGPVHWLALSRDSQFVYFLDSTRNVSRVSIKGGKSRAYGRPDELSPHRMDERLDGAGPERRSAPAPQRGKRRSVCTDT